MLYDASSTLRTVSKKTDFIYTFLLQRCSYPDFDYKHFSLKIKMSNSELIFDWGIRALRKRENVIMAAFDRRVQNPNRDEQKGEFLILSQCHYNCSYGPLVCFRGHTQLETFSREFFTPCKVSNCDRKCQNYHKSKETEWVRKFRQSIRDRTTVLKNAQTNERYVYKLTCSLDKADRQIEELKDEIDHLKSLPPQIQYVQQPMYMAPGPPPMARYHNPYEIEHVQARPYPMQAPPMDPRLMQAPPMDPRLMQAPPMDPRLMQQY
jgi:hypothetical protein